MVEPLLKVWSEGGYPLLFCIAAAGVVGVLWRTLQKVVTQLLVLNQKQHEVQMTQLQHEKEQDLILMEIKTRVEKCGK